MSDVMAVSASGGTGSTPAESASKKTAKTTTKDFKETLAKVSGHKYAEIKNGDRKGMFVNQSGNGRDGDAFKLVERDGHVFHVYGEGKDRKVFEVPVVEKK
jgi:hypothetical protein